MIKEEFFEQIKSIIVDQIYLTENTNEIHQEIKENLWSIGITSETARLINLSDFQEFIDRVKANRIDQLNKSDKKQDLLFYLWFDEQAGNLNLNFINANHKELPFTVDFVFVDSVDLIINEFLESKYLDGMTLEELSEEEDLADDMNIYKLKVYKEILKKKSSNAQNINH